MITDGTEPADTNQRGAADGEGGADAAAAAPAPASDAGAESADAGAEISGDAVADHAAAAERAEDTPDEAAQSGGAEEEGGGGEGGAAGADEGDGGSAAFESESGGSASTVVRVGISETIGKRSSMEDAWLHKNVSIGSQSVDLYGVFDGHGGSAASAFCRDTIPEILAGMDEFFDDPAKSIADAVEELEKQWLTKAKEEPQQHDGSTLLLGVVHGKTLYTANVGDSEGVLARSKAPVVLSYVHNPSKNPEEAARIEAAGGRIWRNRLAHPHLNPQFFNLGISGAIGDLMYKDAEYTSGKNSGIATRPHVSTYELGDADDFVILACDGLWDVFSYEDAVEFVYQRLTEMDDPQQACDELVKEAEFNRESQDNITAMILTLKTF